jgi:hypothetical protein
LLLQRICFFVTTCLAADISAVSSMPLKAPPIANYDWSGFCGHVGYSRGYGRNTLFDPNPTAASSSFGSLFGGFQFGYNYLLHICAKFCNRTHATTTSERIGHWSKMRRSQLMSKHRVLGFKPYLRLEWRGQDGQSETEQPDHSASLGDSITSSTRIRFSVHTMSEKCQLQTNFAEEPSGEAHQ